MNLNFQNTNRPNRILHEEMDASDKISQEIIRLLPSGKFRPIVIVCIGTDRSTGDSLGPLVGTLLKEKDPIPSFFVYGTLDDPIHAVNLEEKLAQIKTMHGDPFIVGVDACLGKLKSVGVVQIGDGPVKPGAGVNKELPDVGDAHITGIVNVCGFMEFMVLQNTRLSLVMKMAKTISEGIYHAGLQLKPKPNISPFKWTFEKEKTL
ncbi:spore protease YyaC [Bacillus massiliglaciei]|uniref:spore protease YyaC n=1 Tax=Bacillus massiliglaciei TaxID=1816693 RepID=UPI000ADB87E5|nr:spore protease YyaC [Bacillus massiliglaciei]